jgi:hypothetical protein
MRARPRAVRPDQVALLAEHDSEAAGWVRALQLDHLPRRP